MLVDVHLHQLDPSAGFRDRLFQRRRQLFARPAPRRPEIHQNRLVARFLDHVLRELGGGRIADEIRHIGGGRLPCARIVSELDRSGVAVAGRVRIVVAVHRNCPFKLAIARARNVAITPPDSRSAAHAPFP